MELQVAIPSERHERIAGDEQEYGGETAHGGERDGREDDRRSDPPDAGQSPFAERLLLKRDTLATCSSIAASRCWTGGHL